MSWSSRRRAPRRGLGRAPPGRGFACSRPGLASLYGRLRRWGRRPGTGQVHIQPIADRTGQNLYNELRDRMNSSGVPGDPRLRPGDRRDRAGAAVPGPAGPDRDFGVDLTLYANFALYQRGRARKPPMIGQSRSTTSDDQLTNSTPRSSRQDDARRRGAVTPGGRYRQPGRGLSRRAAGPAAGPRRAGAMPATSLPSSSFGGQTTTR